MAYFIFLGGPGEGGIVSKSTLSGDLSAGK